MKVLVKGIEILIDECDLDLIRDHNWCLTTSSYMCGSGGEYRGVYLHIIIAGRMGLDCSNDIDHEDVNTLNNQRLNLRSETRSQNLANGKLRINNTSGYKGVSRYKDKWRAQICVKRKQITIGYFYNKEDAARAYDKAALKNFSKFARLNFLHLKLSYLLSFCFSS